MNVIWLQKSVSRPACCVNLGIHYAFLSKAGTSEPISDDLLEQSECEIALRLTAQDGIADQWWPFSVESASEVIDLVSARALAVFDRYRLAGSISDMVGSDIEAGNPGLLSCLTEARACLLLARLHERLGDIDNCVDAAMIGLRLSPERMTGPREAFKDLLDRHGRRA